MHGRANKKMCAPDPRGQYAMTWIVCLWQNSTRAVCCRYGWHSIWFTVGVTFAVSCSWCKCLIVKFDTPIAGTKSLVYLGGA